MFENKTRTITLQTNPDQNGQYVVLTYLLEVLFPYSVQDYLIQSISNLFQQKD